VTITASLVNCNQFGGTFLTAPISATDLQFRVFSTQNWCEVAADGSPSQVPLGQSGPFLIEVDGEGILCSSFSGPLVYVYQDGATNGRGYSGSAIAHSAGVQTKQNLTVTATAAQGNIPSTSSAQTLTNKRITRRVDEITTNIAAPVYDTDNYDAIVLTGQTTAITSMTSGATGTPNDGDLLQIAITGSATTISWGANFEASTVALPTVTVLTHRLDNFFVWNAATSKWRIYLSA
jgi:hypothetical protein